MRGYLRIFLIFVLSALLLAACSKESNQTANDLYDSATELYKKGQIPQALEKAKSALQKAEVEYGRDNPALLKFLQTLAYIYQDEKDFNEAESVYKRSLNIIRKVYGESSFEEAKLMNNLAVMYALQHQYDKAISAYKKSLAAAVKRLPKGDPRLKKIEENIENCKKLKLREASSPGTGLTASRQKMADIVPEKIKKAALDRLAKQNIILSDLQPEALVRIGTKGVVLPYRCTQKGNDSAGGGSDVLLLFAAVKDPAKKGAYIFKECRLVSYDSYQAELEKGGLESLKQVLINIFPDIF